VTPILALLIAGVACLVLAALSTAPARRS